MASTQNSFWQKFNLFDGLVLLILGLVVAGIVLVQSGTHQTADAVTQGTRDVEYTVILKNASMLNPQELFKAGDTVSLTVRNRPRGNIKVLSTIAKRDQTLSAGGGAVDNPGDVHAYDVQITLRDTATLSDKGFVANGVNIKAGMDVVLEDTHHQYRGIVIDVHAIK